MGRARVHRLDVLLVEHLLERVRAAVENDHVGGGDVLEHLRTDVVRVDLEGGRVDRRDDLVQLPARRERLHQRLELPHAVVLDDDAVGVVLLLDALEDVRGQTVFGLDRTRAVP